MFKIIVSSLLIIGYVVIRLIWWKTDPRPIKERMDWFFQPINLITGILYAAATYLAFILYFKDYYLFTGVEIFVSILGVTLFFAGMYLACWARFYMGKYWAPANDGHNFQSQSKLHTGGPFKYTRNPIYVGLFITGIGFFLAVNSYLIVIMGLIYWYLNKSINEEEPLLSKHFGEEYSSYKKKTPRFLFR